MLVLAIACMFAQLGIVFEFEVHVCNRPGGCGGRGRVGNVICLSKLVVMRASAINKYERGEND